MAVADSEMAEARARLSRSLDENNITDALSVLDKAVGGLIDLAKGKLATDGLAGDTVTSPYGSGPGGGSPGTPAGKVTADMVLDAAEEILARENNPKMKRNKIPYGKTTEGPYGAGSTANFFKARQGGDDDYGDGDDDEGDLQEAFGDDDGPKNSRSSRSSRSGSRSDNSDDWYGDDEEDEDDDSPRSEKNAGWMDKAEDDDWAKDWDADDDDADKGWYKAEEGDDEGDGDEEDDWSDGPPWEHRGSSRSGSSRGGSSRSEKNAGWMDKAPTGGRMPPPPMGGPMGGPPPGGPMGGPMGGPGGEDGDPLEELRQLAAKEERRSRPTAPSRSRRSRTDQDSEEESEDAPRSRRSRTDQESEEKGYGADDASFARSFRRQDVFKSLVSGRDGNRVAEVVEASQELATMVNVFGSYLEHLSRQIDEVRRDQYNSAAVLTDAVNTVVKSQSAIALGLERMAKSATVLAKSSGKGESIAKSLGSTPGVVMNGRVLAEGAALRRSNALVDETGSVVVADNAVESRLTKSLVGNTIQEAVINGEFSAKDALRWLTETDSPASGPVAVYRQLPAKLQDRIARKAQEQE